MPGIEHLGISAGVCEQEVSQQKELFRAESLQLGYLMLWELSCFTQLSWFLGTCVCDTVCVPSCRLFWCRAGVKTLQCSCLSTHMVLTDCVLKIDENISPEQIL